MINKTILIIASDNNTRRSLTDDFFDEEYTVSSAASGQEGLELLIKEQPALAIIDQVMPEMDGVETPRRLKEIRGRI